MKVKKGIFSLRMSLYVDNTFICLNLKVHSDRSVRIIGSLNLADYARMVKYELAYICERQIVKYSVLDNFQGRRSQ